MFSPSVLPSRHAIEMQVLLDPAHQSGQPAGVEKSSIQIFVA